MRVLVPFTDLRLETKEALDRYGRDHDVVYCDVSGSDTAYCELLALEWSRGETVAVIEQDIVVGRETLDGFEACPRPYCAAPYPWTVAVGPALGCTRFGASLLAMVPDAMERVAARPTNWGPPGHWRQLDVALLGWILRDEEGLQPHVHLPAVQHANSSKKLHAAFADDAVVTEYIAGTPAAWMLQARLHGIERVR